LINMRSAAVRTYLRRSIILLFIVCTCSCKKDLLQWHTVQHISSGTNCGLNNIKFINDSICIIAGGIQYAQSEVLRSADGGYTFTSNSYSQAPLCMYGMCLSPTGTVYLCGTYGRTLSSIDNGLTWNAGRIQDYLFYVSLSFPSPDTGVCISTVLQRQSTITVVDSNFNILNETTYQFGLNNVYMISPSTGYVIGYGAVLKTTDYRQTWNFQNINGDNFTAMDIHGDEMWICGANGSIFHTTDGGSNWQRQRNGNDFTQVHYGLRCIVFADENNGWAAGDDGKMIYSSDGGAHWSQYTQFTTSAIRSLAICPNGDVLAAGDNGALFRLGN
jgi:photosystem II stability/assembly factor-like uncharacterized protein